MGKDFLTRKNEESIIIVYCADSNRILLEKIALLNQKLLLFGE